jgi:hypothetical protein
MREYLNGEEKARAENKKAKVERTLRFAARN